MFMNNVKTSLLEKIVKIFYILAREEETYTIKKEKQWWKFYKIIKIPNIEKKQIILNEFEIQKNYVKKMFLISGVIFFLLIYCIIPIIVSLSIYTTNILFNKHHQTKVFPELIINCVYDPVCNKSIEGLNINIESQQVIISQKTFLYYKELYQQNRLSNNKITTYYYFNN